MARHTLYKRYTQEHTQSSESDEDETPKNPFNSYVNEQIYQNFH